MQKPKRLPDQAEQQLLRKVRVQLAQRGQLPEYRARVESYPRFSLAALILLAMLCEAPRGQTDLEKFARGLSQGQRRALGIRRNRQGQYPAPSKSTFSRFLAGVNPAQLEATLLSIEQQMRGPAPKDELVVLDGEEPQHGSGASILTAVSVPSQYYLGSAVGVVMEAGGDYLLAAKKSQPTLLANIRQKVAAPQADFPPLRSRRPPKPAPRRGTRDVTKTGSSARPR